MGEPGTYYLFLAGTRGSSLLKDALSSRLSLTRRVVNLSHLGGLDLHEWGRGETSQAGISLTSNLATLVEEGPGVARRVAMKPEEKLE